MKSAQFFDFTVNKETNTINVTREFAANLDLVWDAWTKPEILDQWWAPKPWRAETKSMTFEEGGYWLYCMISPTNEKHWSRVDFKKIDPKKSYSTLDSFCDEEGIINPDFSLSSWTIAFSANDNSTTVAITIQFDKAEDLDKMIDMGFKEGLTMGLQNLDELLEKQAISGRKIIVLSHITLDGVMQAPGGPEEDTSDGFKYGGWSAPYTDEVAGKIMEKQLAPADILLGRKTFDIFASYWPEHADQWPGINEVTKYVLSNTISQSDWNNTVFLTNVADIEKLKHSEGSDLKVWGSSELVQLLLKHDLVDEFWLNIHPLLLGHGKKLYDNYALPAAFELAAFFTTPKGVIIANYKRAGDVKTGTVGE